MEKEVFNDFVKGLKEVEDIIIDPKEFLLIRYNGAYPLIEVVSSNSYIIEKGDNTIKLNCRNGKELTAVSWSVSPSGIYNDSIITSKHKDETKFYEEIYNLVNTISEEISEYSPSMYTMMSEAKWGTPLVINSFNLGEGEIQINWEVMGTEDKGVRLEKLNGVFLNRDGSLPKEHEEILDKVISEVREQFN